MLYLDYFFLFMGLNSETNAAQTALLDPSQYLFLMKEMQVKSEFKMHARVLFMDKNIENPLNNKYLLSLGEDEIIDQSSGAVAQKALVFKIWDFISLDSKYSNIY